MSSVVTQWKIACARKRHARWLLKIKVTMRKIIAKIEAAEENRTELLKEVRKSKVFRIIVVPHLRNH